MPKQTKEIERLAVELRKVNPESAESLRRLLDSAVKLLTAIGEASSFVADAESLLHAVTTEALAPINRALDALSEEGDPHG